MINPKIATSGEILNESYEIGLPFPHIVFSDFLDPTVLSMALFESKNISKDLELNKWRFNEKDAHEHQVLKHGISNVEFMTPMLYAISHYMNSEVFLNFLRNLTGIEDLIGDPALVGGGLHITEPGGKLGIHHDFTQHEINGEKYNRHVNLLIYLNEEWEESWGGQLQLWNSELTSMVKELPLEFNNAVIFNIDDAPHGHPDPLKCPEGYTRRSLAFYYYSKKETNKEFKRAHWKVGNSYA